MPNKHQLNHRTKAALSRIQSKASVQDVVNQLTVLSAGWPQRLQFTVYFTLSKRMVFK
jgi:hypothetical protein